jgi:hypothetical protein
MAWRYFCRLLCKIWFPTIHQSGSVFTVIRHRSGVEFSTRDIMSPFTWLQTWIQDAQSVYEWQDGGTRVSTPERTWLTPPQPGARRCAAWGVNIGLIQPWEFISSQPPTDPIQAFMILQWQLISSSSFPQLSSVSPLHWSVTFLPSHDMAVPGVRRLGWRRASPPAWEGGWLALQLEPFVL